MTCHSERYDLTSCHWLKLRSLASFEARIDFLPFTSSSSSFPWFWSPSASPSPTISSRSSVCVDFTAWLPLQLIPRPNRSWKMGGRWEKQLLFKQLLFKQILPANYTVVYRVSQKSDLNGPTTSSGLLFEHQCQNMLLVLDLPLCIVSTKSYDIILQASSPRHPPSRGVFENRDGCSGASAQMIILDQAVGWRRVRSGRNVLN